MAVYLTLLFSKINNLQMPTVPWLVMKAKVPARGSVQHSQAKGPAPRSDTADNINFAGQSEVWRANLLSSQVANAGAHVGAFQESVEVVLSRGTF